MIWKGFGYYNFLLTAKRLEQRISNTFKINKNGRPEGTVATDLGVLHYTCNSPRRDILDQLGIVAIGKKFNVEVNEVLLISNRLFESSGLPMDEVGAEILLRDIEGK